MKKVSIIETPNDKPQSPSLHGIAEVAGEHESNGVHLQNGCAPAHLEDKQIIDDNGEKRDLNNGRGKTLHDQEQLISAAMKWQALIQRQQVRIAELRSTGEGW